MFDLTASNKLSNESSTFSHTLVNHPLLQMDEIRKLVRRVPRDRISFSAGEKPETADIGKAPTAYKSEHSLEHAIDNMENANAYMYISGPEVDPEFNQVYQDIKADLELHCLKNGYQLWDSRLFLFISSPGAVTPYHLDHQHTLLAQIKGKKTLNLWPALNYELTPPNELETFCSLITRKFEMREEFEHLRKPLEMVPGEGVYLPFLAPHSVKNSDEVSISLSIIFNTFESQKIWNGYRLNYFLRNKLHLSPSLPGTSAWKDELKHQLVRVLDRLKHMGWLKILP
jgi:hypothetical protein